MMNCGYFWKEIRSTDDYTTYSNENLYPDYKLLIHSIVLCYFGKNSCVTNEIVSKASKGKDALEVCRIIKECLMDYIETCDCEIDICFTCINSS